LPQYPRTFSHIGLSVPDVDAAVKFYSDVLGFYVIMPPTDVTEDKSDIGVMCSDVFGSNWKKLRIAHLATADRVGIEVFEFEGNYAPENNMDFRRNGMFHFCIQDPDVEGLVEKIVAAGGKQRMPFDITILMKNQTEWSMSKTLLAWFLKSTATHMN
jgi:lactoylglutathione lyase family protein